MNNLAIETLNSFLTELEAKSEFKSLEEKAEHIGHINQIKSALGQLKLCEKYGINSGALVNVLPETENPNFCYLTVHENESSNPCNWEEVKFDGNQVLLSGGDLVIRR